MSLLPLFLQQEMENLTPSNLSQSGTCMILQLASDHILIGGVIDPKDSFLPPLWALCSLEAPLFLPDTRLLQGIQEKFLLPRNPESHKCFTGPV